MTHAPADLLAVRQYLLSSTGLSGDAVGIVGDPEHAASGGYHEGRSDLTRVGRATTDYSVRESARDKAGLTDAASALDIGAFTRSAVSLRTLTLGLVAACQRGDPRCADVREVIYTPDGSTVRRWDRLGIRSTGDSSHLYHTHISFFRDSEGRRAQAGNVLGLLRELVDGKPTEQGDHMNVLVYEGSTSGPLWCGNGVARHRISLAVGEHMQALDRKGVQPLANSGNPVVETNLAMMDAYGVDLDGRDAVRDAADQARDAAARAAIDALTAAVAAGGGSIDSAAIIARIDAAAAQESAAVAGLRAQLADRDRAAAAAWAGTPS